MYINRNEASRVRSKRIEDDGVSFSFELHTGVPCPLCQSDVMKSRWNCFIDPGMNSVRIKLKAETDCTTGRRRELEHLILVCGALFLGNTEVDAVQGHWTIKLPEVSALGITYG